MEFLKKISALFLILRPKNLVITGITLYILQWHVISPLLVTKLALQGSAFVFFMLTTLFIIASGNVVNDIFDRETDRINKPDKTYVGSILSVRTAWMYYFMLILGGAATALYVAWKTHQWYNIWIYPLVCWLLYTYARKWKSTVLFGNFIISLFVALVWGILFYAQISQDPRGLFADSPSPETFILQELCITYFFFAFFINFIREIIKDLEDMDGDRKAGLQTLPIARGEKRTLGIVLWLISGLVISITGWVLLSPVTADFMVRFFYILFVAGPLARVFIMLKANPSPPVYTKASQTLKLVMLFALIALLLIQKNY